jgi:hypothetical protein
MSYAIFFLDFGHTENRHQADKLVGWLGTRPTNLSAISTKILTKEFGYLYITEVIGASLLPTTMQICR